MDELTTVSVASTRTQPPHLARPRVDKLSHTYSPVGTNEQQRRGTPPARSSTPTTSAARLAQATPDDIGSYASSPDDRTETLSIPAPVQQVPYRPPSSSHGPPPPPASPPPARTLPRQASSSVNERGGAWVRVGGAATEPSPSPRSSNTTKNTSPCPTPVSPYEHPTGKHIAFPAPSTSGTAPSSQVAVDERRASPRPVTPPSFHAAPPTPMGSVGPAKATHKVVPGATAAQQQQQHHQPLVAVPGSQSTSHRPSPSSSAALAHTAPTGISSEVAILASPSTAPAPPHQDESPRSASPSYCWYHPPPATQQLPLSLMSSPRNGGGAAALFDTASEAVSTLEQQYRATLKQLDIVQGMYTRLNAHNDELGGEFNALRAQLEGFRESVNFGLYNEVRRVKAEARSLRNHVDLMLTEFAQYLHLMGHEVLQGVRDAVSEATGESALLPYYKPDTARAKATAASVAAAATGVGLGPRSHYNPSHWLGAISPKGSSDLRSITTHRRPEEDGQQQRQDPHAASSSPALGGSGAEDGGEEMKLLLALPPADSEVHHGSQHGTQALSASSGGSGSLQFWGGSSAGGAAEASIDSQPDRQIAVVTQRPDSRTVEEQLADVRRQLVLAEGKLRVTQQDAEKRVRRIKEAYGEKEKTLTAELVLLRRALGMPTDDLPPYSAVAAPEEEEGARKAVRGGGVEEGEGWAYQERGVRERRRVDRPLQQSNTLPYRDSVLGGSAPDSLGDPSPPNNIEGTVHHGSGHRHRRPAVDDDGLLDNTYPSITTDSLDNDEDHLRPGKHAMDGKEWRHGYDDCMSEDEHLGDYFDSDAAATEEGETVTSATATESARERQLQWYDTGYGDSGHHHLPMRKRYAPLLFDSSDGRAVEKKVRAMVAQARHRRQQRSGAGGAPREDEYDLSEWDRRTRHWERGGDVSCSSSEADADGDSKADHRKDHARTPPRDSAPDSRQRWQRPAATATSPRGTLTRPGRGVRSGIHQSDHYSPSQERRLEDAAQRLLALVEKEKGEKASNAAAQQKKGRPSSGDTSFSTPRRDMGTAAAMAGKGKQAGAVTLLGPGVRQLPEQEARDIQRQAEGRLIPSGQLTRPTAPSDVSKVAQGLWAEQLLAQRGLSSS